MEKELLQGLLLVLIGMGAGFVQRVSGFGLGIFAMLFLPHFMPDHTAAAAISSLFSCATTSYNALRYRKAVSYKTALREIKEETGLEVTLLSDFRTEDSHALVREGRPDVMKHIVYFLAEYSGHQLQAQDPEVSRIALMTYEEAMGSFQFESSRRILREADNYLKTVGEGH